MRIIVVLPCLVRLMRPRTVPCGGFGVWMLSMHTINQLPASLRLRCSDNCCDSKVRFEALQSALLTHTWADNQEPSFIWLKVETQAPRYDLYDLFADTLKAHEPERRPLLVSVDNIIPELQGGVGRVSVDIRTTPVEVFSLLLQEKGVDPKHPNLQDLFAYVLSQLGVHNIDSKTALDVSDSMPHEESGMDEDNNGATIAQSFPVDISL